MWLATIGQILKEARTASGAKQGATAAAVGISRETLRLWEGDLAVPSMPALDRLLDHLQAPKTVRDRVEDLWIERMRSRGTSTDEVRRVRDEDVDDGDGLPVRHVDEDVLDDEEAPCR